jgi:hypothetical protein
VDAPRSASCGPRIEIASHREAKAVIVPLSRYSGSAITSGAAARAMFISHCLVIHFVARPPSNLLPKGIAACSHAEWVESFALAERKASCGRKDPCVEAIQILEAKQV